MTQGQDWALSGGLLLAAAQAAGLLGNTLAVISTEHGSTHLVAGSAGSAVRAAFPGEYLVAEAQPGCHVVLLSSEGEKITALGARTAIVRARGLAMSGTRTFIASLYCSEETGAKEFDAAVLRRHLDAINRANGAEFCSGWIVGESL